VTVPVRSRDGSSEFASVAAGSSAGHVKVSDASGNSKDVLWKELAPESLIELHRQLVRNERNDVERLRRHEAAVAFDWLCGDRARALAAAERLAADNASFKAHWQSVRNGLGE